MLRTDLTNEEYHAVDLKNFSVSSSQIKAILEDPEKFYKLYITKELDKPKAAAFDLGTYFHTAVLEPHLLEKECAVYPGRRAGKAWEDFLSANAGKAIITASEKESAERMINAVKESPVAMDLISDPNTRKEVSCFVDVFVTKTDVYAKSESGLCYILESYGWIATAEIPEDAIKITIKVRADAINFERGFVADLKSMSGSVKDVFGIKKRITDYTYDMSASLYLDIFTLNHLLTEEGGECHSWYFIFSSKDMGISKTYLASKEAIEVGRAKWKWGIILLAHYFKNNWVFQDELGVIGPQSWDIHDWLNTPRPELKDVILNSDVEEKNTIETLSFEEEFGGIEL